jgi:hypothetical protein
MEKPPPTRVNLLEYIWKEGDLRWKLWEQQKLIHGTIRDLPPHVQTVVVLCARQYGKSFLGAAMAVEDCLKYPGYSIVIVGPTIKQTVDIVNQGMRIIEQDAPLGLIRRSKSESRWYIGESELIIGGFDVRTATRQRGKRALKIYIEEVVDSNPDDYLEALRSDLGPMLTHSPAPQMIFLTTPPRIPDHPFLTDTVPEAKLYGAFFKFTIHDNKQLSADQYEACVRRSGGENTIEFKREYLCEIVRDASVVVVPDFDRGRHVKAIELPEHSKTQVTMDWGGVKDMTVGLIHTYDYLLDMDIVLDERVFPPNTSTEVIVEQMRKVEALYNHFGIHARYADVPGQIQVDLINTHNYQVQLPQKHDWQAGINGMCVKFATDKIAVHPRCKFTIQSLDSGTFNKQKTDFERTQALGHCDALAALSYAIRMQDRTNPWPNRPPSRDTSFYIPKPAPEISVAEALQPESFANGFTSSYFKPKRFGSFR